MMFPKVLVSTLAVAAVTVAVPTGGDNGSQCTTSAPQCCQNVVNSSSVGSVITGLIKGLLGIDISDLNIPIGTGCTSLDILAGVSCNQNTVYCGDVIQNSLIGINCVPIIINL